MAKTKTTQQIKPPIVTIMGHVDHGKTTLLDQIRKSNLTSKEAGGITQKIGAYQVEYKGKKITFIDTPGHAAFSKMRARGASITDIIILVVAADDGVKPQTKESIKHIKNSLASVVVAINKVDVKTASPEMVKAQLYEEGIQVEGYGGSVPVVEISARQGTNIDKLLETVLLVAEMDGLTVQPNAPLEAVVIESQLKRNQGPVATLLVTAGQLETGMELVALDDPNMSGKAKRLVNDRGQGVNVASVGTPVELLGMKAVPQVGTVLTTPELVDTIKAKNIDSNLSLENTTAEVPVVVEPAPIQEVADQGEKINIKVILVADTLGSLEAIKQNLTDEIELIHSSTGEVNESDVLLAHTTGAVVIAFNTSIVPAAKKLAEVEKVPLKRYQIIYELLEDFEKQILKLLEPTIDEQELGQADVLATFNIKGVAISGCKVKSGMFSVGDRVHLKRGTRFLNDATVMSIKQGKVDVKSVEAGHECGLVLKPVLDVRVGDGLMAFKKVNQ